LTLYGWQWTDKLGFAAWLRYCRLGLALLFVAWFGFVMVGNGQLGLASMVGKSLLGLALLWSAGLTWHGQ
jgi:hypothetical protein